jgi:hypothetical protein
VVYNCGTEPDIHTIQDPVRMDWKPLVKVEHYQVAARAVLETPE